MDWITLLPAAVIAGVLLRNSDYPSWLSILAIIDQHKGLRELIEAIPEQDWTPIPYWMDGAADVAETTYRARLIRPIFLGLAIFVFRYPLGQWTYAPYVRY